LSNAVGFDLYIFDRKNTDFYSYPIFWS